LPEMHSGPFVQEWALRRDTCRRFAHYLQRHSLQRAGDGPGMR
jgi:hypothetical protein